MSFSIHITVKQKIDKIYLLLTFYVACIFAEWSLDFYHAAGLFIALHSVLMTISLLAFSVAFSSYYCMGNKTLIQIPDFYT